MEYRSQVEFLGLPLVHVATSKRVDGRIRRGVARGWIAAGDVAFGVLFAAGGVAVGGVSCGGVSLGLLGFGGCALGFLALGGLAVGAEAALGGLAIAGKMALGGLAIAGQAAAGGEAHAPRVGEEAVRAYFDARPFFRYGEMAARHSRWLLILPLLLPFVFLWRRLTRPETPGEHR